MNNQEIIRQIELYASLLELEGENAFKIRSYQVAVDTIEKIEQDLTKLNLTQLEQLPGVGKAIAGKIFDATQNGMFRQLKEILTRIPAGVVEMLSISGLGAKKIITLWKEIGIENTDQLLQACENNQIAQIKGFGAKTQENILQALLFKRASSDKMHFAKAEKIALAIHQFLNEKQLIHTVVGQIRRKLEVIDSIQIVVQEEDTEKVFALLDDCPLLEKNTQQTGLFAWRGTAKDFPIKVEIRLVATTQYVKEVFIHSASEKHLNYVWDNQTILEIAQQKSYASEENIYAEIGLPFIQPELREGFQEFTWAKENRLPKLVEVQDLKGILHAHSTYSDGKHTLEVMAKACKEAGYQYLGITDHSKSAFYANGLYENRVRDQHIEIDKLNQQLAPFRIFKGIESDILSDGALDYAPDVLATFDFVIASVHSGLKMTAEKATERLIKAIENPFTTILGHPTGRLLLDREGYPIDHTKVIEACAGNGVIIEINASPWRLDLDWRWVNYALEKGVLISINPDSHAKDKIEEVYYGVCVGRKGGLTAAMTFNALSTEEVAHYFEKRKMKR